ncbi:MAG TPA: hypothetical protein VFG10_09070 [Saprospiraceae bacterium]|nr:hypothetical protein [Saprospiraceae bacterium]
MKHLLLLFIFFPVHYLIQAQGVSVNETGAAPNASAMLDIQSTSKGVLIPRMTTAQRTGIAAPATGLLVFDNTTASFWYRTASAWVELTDNFHGLRDADHDTQVQVEQSPDEDIIRFDIGGVEAMVLDESVQGATRLEIGPDHSLLIGHNAGLNSYAGWNTFLGYEAGLLNTTGDRNVFVGYRAGQNNTGHFRNVLIGYESGLNNNGDYNTFVGHQTGRVNTTGLSNTFIGADAGVQNTTGFRNVFMGQNAGHNNEITDENTFIGFSAGYNNEADRNTFLGYEAGLANRTGLYNTILGGEAAGTNLSNRDMGNGNTIVGYEAAQVANGMTENVLLGYRAGYSMTNGIRNIFIGPNAGLSQVSSYANIGIGPGSLRSNMTGSRNVAVGDSTLYSNTASTNVAVGSKAGMDNTTGSGNTFLGFLAGSDNTTGGDNTFLGSRAGNFNKTGRGNVAIGTESANANTNGDYNAFIGLAAGFRNDSGHENVFLGRQAGEHNLDGISNIAIGSRAGNHNDNGDYNIAIGELSLGNQVNNHVAITKNIAIGFHAGENAIGSSNIILGNDSGGSIAGGNNLLIGNNITPYGYNNTYLGTGTTASLFGSPHNATAVGYGASISQDYSVILGDADNIFTKVGIGTTSPTALLHVNSHSGSDVLYITSNGNNALRVLQNRDVIIDHQLMVNTTTGKDGYEVSINGDIACEEVLVQASEDWPDHVFAEDYALMNMDELRNYLIDKKHLPGIPSATEVLKEGVKLGDMQERLLEKIEEMTLYILQLESRINALENK